MPDHQNEFGERQHALGPKPRRVVLRWLLIEEVPRRRDSIGPVVAPAFAMKIESFSSSLPLAHKLYLSHKLISPLELSRAVAMSTHRLTGLVPTELWVQAKLLFAEH
jgi:hypothetical protein